MFMIPLKTLNQGAFEICPKDTLYPLFFYPNLFINTSKKRAKKQRFETLPSKKEETGPCKEGWGAAPF
jgi:hypothetical protein